MTIISTEASRAFINGDKYKASNTQVLNVDGVTTMKLFGNPIASKTEAQGLRITNSGWMTKTTRERLNAIPGVWVRQSKGIWYLNEREWNGEWVNVLEWDKDKKP